MLRFLFLIVTALIAALVVALAGTLGVIAVGWVAIQVFPSISLLEASIIALVISTGLLLLLYRLLDLSSLPFNVPPDEFEEDWEDWEDEEEDEPPIVPWRRSEPGRGSSTSSRRGAKRGGRR